MPFMTHMSEATVAKKAGMNPKLSLRTACSDFYLLERLTTADDRRAAAAIKRLEEGLTKEFVTYMDMIVGGELRYAPKMVRGGDDYTYEEGYDCETCECEYDRDDDLDYECNHCTGECWCSKQSVAGSRARLPSGLDPFFKLLDKPKTKTQTSLNGRSRGWQQWLKYRKKAGVTGLDLAVETFKMDWSSGYGGPQWATVAEVVRDCVTGHISRRTFLDRCWTLEHNGGNVFNKLYIDTNELTSALKKQAADNYNYLAHYATPDVSLLWKSYNVRERLSLGMDPLWLGVQPTFDWEEDV